ncbi:MAG: acetolactate synthase small subunit [candidate division NC10 bacterium]|nr:acetolactate synthase small subunit [candidate division NC10 bacterium]
MTDPKHYRKHTLSLLVENHQGVLAKIASLIAAKGYNIDSLSVAETLDESISRMTMSVRGDEWVMEQVVKQFHRIIDVIKVVDLTDEPHVNREMIFIRVNAEPANRAEILRITEIFRGRIVDVTPMTYTLEITGESGKIEAVLELLQPFGVQEIVRSGTLAIARGSKTITKRDETKLRLASRKQAVAE